MNILDTRFKYVPARDHSDPAAFRERMKERMKQAQAKQPQPQAIQLKRSKTA